MKCIRSLFALACCALLATALAAQQPEQKSGDPPVMESGGKGKKAPEVWIDAKTGHRVFRLSPPGGGSATYFHDNSYVAESDKVCFTAGGSIVAVDLKALEKGEVKRETLVSGGL